MRKQFKTIDKYIASFPKSVQVLLNRVRQTVHKVAPEAKEAIKYGMPAFVLNGNLVFFGGYDKHIGFYPLPGPIKQFKKELAPYKIGKGSIQFPLDKPIPYKLIEKIVAFRVKQARKS